MPKQIRNAATIVAAPNISSATAPFMKNARDKKQLNGEGGDGNDEGSPGPSDNNKCHKEPPKGGSEGIRANLKTPFSNPDPFQQWYGIENVTKVKINGESCMALLDNGAQVNTITPRYVNEHSLQVGPITDLMGSKVTYMGLGNAYTRPLGYVVEGVQGYDEDQISLIIPDFSNFATRVPIILGVPTIGCVVNVMREAEMDALAMPWVNGRVAHLLAVHRMMPMDVGDDQEEKFDSNDDDPLMYTQKAEILEPFSSHIIPVKTGEAYLGECINVMVQALWTQDGTLPPGLTIQNTYTKLRKGSKKAVVVVWNKHCLPTNPPEENPCGQGSSSIASARTP